MIKIIMFWLGLAKFYNSDILNAKILSFILII